MANDLTGDFDVVAEFSIPAANRVLAAMHRGQRFPHSMSIQVNPAPPPAATTEVPGRTIRTLVNQYGDALDDPIYVAQPPASLRSVLPDPGLSAVDTLVNPRFTRPGALEPPTHLSGVAQLQLSAPTMIPPDEASTRITLDMQMMARYFPEPNTRPMPEFLRGGIQTAVDVQQVASQVGNVMDINLKGSNLGIVFSPAFADRTLDPSDVQAIQTVIRDSIQTSFLPSNAVLPSNIQQMQFKTLPGELPALGVLLNMAPDPNIIVAQLAGVTVSNDPESVNSVFLQDGDDFALAVGRDFILLKFNLFVSQAFPVRQFTVQSSLADYTVFIDSLTIDLQNGKFLLAVKGRAITGSVFPNFTFDASQAFKLNIADDGEVAGGTAELALRGDLASSVTSSKNAFSGMATPVVSGILRGEVKKRLGTFLNQAQPTVRGMLSAQKNLGEFLTSLMNPITPPPKPGQEPPETVNPTLAYTLIEIRSSGIVLHGSLAVDDWPAAHVLFEGIPVYRSRANDPTGVNDPFRRIDDVFTATRAAAHDYSALLSWIPGGTVQQYIWSVRGQPQPVRIDSNRFVLMNAPDIPSPGVATSLLGFVPLCLTVAGTRLSASGPVVEEPVSATRCGWSSNPLGVLNALTARVGGNRFLPDVPLTQMTASGALEVVGHASPWEAGSGANLIVHVPDERTAGALEFLTQALRESERTDAATAIVTVLTPNQFARTRHTEGVIYAEDADGAWERLLGVKRRPATIVVGTRGDVVWQHEGELPSGTLAAALKAHLVAGGFAAPRMLRLSLRIGQAPPNFLFEYAPGRELTLRKLVGRPVVLVFWKSSSKPSLETVRVLQKTSGQAGGQGPVVLAINYGEAPELVQKVAAENGLSAIVVPDPEREISKAYGVNLWPTAVFIDASGLVRDIRYAGFSGEQVEYPSRAKTAAAQSPRYKAEAPPKKTEKGKTERSGRTRRTPKE